LPCVQPACSGRLRFCNRGRANRERSSGEPLSQAPSLGRSLVLDSRVSCAEVLELVWPVPDCAILRQGHPPAATGAALCEPCQSRSPYPPADSRGAHMAACRVEPWALRRGLAPDCCSASEPTPRPQMLPALGPEVHAPDPACRTQGNGPDPVAHSQLERSGGLQSLTPTASAKGWLPEIQRMQRRRDHLGPCTTETGPCARPQPGGGLPLPGQCPWASRRLGARAADLIVVDILHHRRRTANAAAVALARRRISRWLACLLLGPHPSSRP